MRFNIVGIVLAACVVSHVYGVKVVSITPAQDNVHHTSSRVTLRGRDSIEVTFDRPIIALGSDYVDGDLAEELWPFELSGAAVPGRVRWVTTYIARFDADIDWPASVEFTLQVKEGYEAYNGDVVVCEAGECAMEYVTQSLGMSMGQVRSSQAEELTDGEWSASIAPLGGEGGELFEFPPDAVAELTFSSPIEVDLISAHVTLTSSSGSSRAINVGVCEHELDVDVLSRRCVAVAMQDESSLDVDERAHLCVAANVPFHRYSGHLHEELCVSVSGLYPFKFPFVPSAQLQPMWQRYDLWLRHGLAPDVSLDDVHDCIAIEPDLHFHLHQPRPGALRIHGHFMPESSYQISIEDCEDVRDGFGLPLQAHSISFRTAAWPSFLRGAHITDNFEKYRQIDGLRYFTRNHKPIPAEYDVELMAISAHNVPKLLLALGDNTSPREAGISGDVEGIKIGEQSTDLEESTLSFERFRQGDASPLFALTEYRRTWGDYISKETVAFSFTQLSASFITTSGAKVIAWVTDSERFSVVEGATVTLYERRWKSSGHREVVKIDDGSTDANGMVELQYDSASFDALFALIEYSNEMLLASVPFHYDNTRPLKGVAILDRGVYRANDHVFVKGYVRDPENPATVPEATSYYAQISWRRDQPPTKYDVELDSTFGTLELELNVPSDVELGSKQLYMYEHSRGSHGYNDHMVGSTRFIVADPRPPTVKLNESVAEPVYVPGVGVMLDVHTSTYVGTPVADAEVTLTWHLIRGYSRNFRGASTPTGAVSGCAWTSPLAVCADADCDDTPAPSDEVGTEVLVTGSDGKKSLIFEVEDYSPLEGDTLKVDAEWIGPTGELTQGSVTVEVRNSAWAVALTPSADPVIPGMEFGVRVSVDDATTGAVIGQEVLIRVFEWDGETPLMQDPSTGHVVEGSGRAISFAQVGSCRATSDDGVAVQCVLSVPDTGRYVLVAETAHIEQLGVEYFVATTYPIGRLQSEWELSPLESVVDALLVRADKTTYLPGETATVEFWNPYPEALLLAVSGNDNERHKEVHRVGGGSVSFPVPLGSLRGNGRVVVTLMWPRFGDLSLPVHVPKSPLFEFAQPLTVFREVSIFVRDVDRYLDGVEVAFERDIVDPGEDVTLNFVLDSELEMEVSVMITDEAWLDIAPPYTPNLSVEFTTQRDSYMSQSTTRLALNSGYTEAADTMESRARDNEWFEPERWAQLPGVYRWQPPMLGVPAEVWDAQHSTQITRFPSVATPTMLYGAAGGIAYEDEEVAELAGAADDGLKAGGAAPPANAPLPMATGVAPSSSSSPVSVDAVRTSGMPTPFARLSLVTAGSSASRSVSFTAPNNIGTFKARVFFATTDGAFASAERELVVRRQLNLNSDMPRVVRVGDWIHSGVTLTVADTEFEGDVTVEMKSACKRLLPLTATTSTVTVSAEDSSKPREILFQFQAVEIGHAEFQASVYTTDPSGAVVVMDSIADHVAILPPQDEVFVATSMSIRGSGEWSDWDEGIAIPEAVQGTGVLSLDIGLGHLPSILTYQSSLSKQHAYSSALNSICSLAPLVALDAYPDVDASGATALVHHSIKALSQMTDSRFGLQWSMGVTRPYFQVYLDALALYFTSFPQVHGAGELRNVWSAAVENGLYALIQNDPQHQFHNYDLLADVYLALGPDWMPSQYDEMLSLAKLVSGIDSLSPSSQAKVALMYLLNDDRAGDMQLVREIGGFLQSSIRTQGRTSYISRSGGSPNADPEASALGLEVLVRLGYETQQIGKLAAYVARQNLEYDSDYNPGWGPLQYAYASLALSVLDVSTGSTKPDLSTAVSYDSADLVEADFHSAHDVPVHEEFSMNPFERDGQLHFRTKGTGDATVVAGMTFVPADLPQNGVSRGLVVEKIIQRLDMSTGAASGAAVSTLERGDHVRVTIQVQTADDLRNVMLWDALPGCLEAVDENLFSVPSSHSGFGASPSYGWAFWGGGFSNKQFHREGVQALATWLSAGTYTVTYTAIATTRGHCTVPPAEAWVVRQPEVMGRSAASSLNTAGSVEPVHKDGLGECLDASTEGESSGAISLPYRYSAYESEPSAVSPSPEQDISTYLTYGGILLSVLVAVFVVTLVAVVVHRVLRKRMQDNVEYVMGPMDIEME